MSRAQKKNVRFRLLTGSLLLIEDVIDIKVDSLGIFVTYQEQTKEKVGDELKDIITVKNAWFNTAGVITYQEEFVNA